MELTMAEKIKIVLGRKNLTLAQLAEMTGQTRQNLSNKMHRNNFSEKEMYAIGKALGAEVVCKFIFPDGTEI